MDDRQQQLQSIATQYTQSVDQLKALGAGAEGIVYLTHESTAIKVFTYAEKFRAELAAYERLREIGIYKVFQFSIPRLLAADPSLLVIEMTLVQPPFLLDFAQSVLDWPLEFPEGMDEWWVRVEAAFGNHFTVAQAVYYELQNLAGIYYYDLAPRNLNFGD